MAKPQCQWVADLGLSHQIQSIEQNLSAENLVFAPADVYFFYRPVSKPTLDKIFEKLEIMARTTRAPKPFQIIVETRSESSPTYDEQKTRSQSWLVHKSSFRSLRNYVVFESQ